VHINFVAPLLQYMTKTVFQAEFPKEYDTDVIALDLDAGQASFHPEHYDELKYGGRIWVDGTEISEKRAAQLRRGFVTKKHYFTWGYFGQENRQDPAHPNRITALAICLHIFPDEHIALNMHLPFMVHVMSGWEPKSFEQKIVLTDFIIDHPVRMTHQFITRYFRLGYPFGGFEVPFLAEPGGKVTSPLFETVCEGLLHQEYHWYRINNTGDVFDFAQQGSQRAFDWEATKKLVEKRIAAGWPPQFGPVISSGSLSSAIAKAQKCLRELAHLYQQFN